MTDTTTTRYAGTPVEAQGYGPLASALDAAGVEWDAEDTGGFSLAVTIPTAGGTLVVTREGTDDDYDGWLLGRYPGTGWADGDEAVSYTEHTLPDLLNTLIH